MIRAVAISILAGSPALPILRWRALRARPLTILCYHTLGPDQGGIDGWTVRRVSEFRQDLAYLTKHYHIVSLDEAVDPNSNGTRPQAVITFDDGDQGLAEHLPGVLDATGIPVTVYIATEQIETRRPFWFDRVVNALQAPCLVSVPELGTWSIPDETGKERWNVLRQILAALKAAAPEDRDRLADGVAACGGQPEGTGLGPMTRQDLMALASRPDVTIGAHSHGHELLDQISRDAAYSSIARSRELLQNWTGQQVRHFAFPNGNHTAHLRKIVGDLGFATAAILEERLAPQESDPFALSRISVGRYDNPERVRLRTVGL